MKRSATHEINHFDVGMGAVWNKSDRDYARRMIMPDRFDELQHHLIRRLNDQTAFDSRINKRVEPLQVTQKVDLVVNAGLTRIAELLTGESTTSFTHFASGTGTTAAAAGDTALETELARVSMVTQGSRFATGTSAKFAGFFDETTSSGTVSEGGALDAATNGTLLFHTIYGSTISHTQNVTVYTLSQTLQQSAT